MQPKEELILKAAILARNAPEQWRDFVEALRKHNEVHRDNLVKSPMNELPVNQGRAQMATNLLGMLATCVETADKMKKV